MSRPNGRRRALALGSFATAQLAAAALFAPVQVARAQSTAAIPPATVRPYWAAGRKLEAGYQWRRALTLNPDPDDAAKIEAKLHDTAVPGAVESTSQTERIVQ